MSEPVSGSNSEYANKHPLVRGFYYLEDGMIVAVLLGMIVLAVAEIAMRNFFDSSLLWVGPVLRNSVLWIALLGSMIACRKNEHIAIDIASHYVPKRFQNLLTALIALFTAFICCLMSYYGYLFVAEEKEFATMAFGSTPSWVFQLIIPVAFGVMGLRYLVMVVLALMGRLDVDEAEQEGEV